MTHRATADETPMPVSPEGSSRVLLNPPLQEAVFEFRWTLQEPEGATPGRSFPIDPYYRIASGRFFDRVSHEFTKYESLPTWEMPDAVAAYVAQHRWTPEAGGPILQIGPGILTVNEIRPQAYRWHDFRERCIWAYQVLAESYPAPLPSSSASFQYINSIPFDFMHSDAFEFIASNLNADVIATRRILPTSVGRIPTHFQSVQTFRCAAPVGAVSIVFASIVTHKSEKRLMWQLIFESRGTSMPTQRPRMLEWLDASHSILEEIFFNMIKGNLEGLFA